MGESLSLDLKMLKAAGSFGAASRTMATLEAERAAWRNALSQSDAVAKQMRGLTQVGAAYSQMIKDMRAWQTPALSIAQQYKDLLGTNSSAMQAIKQWQDAQRAERESIRKMMEPLVDIRKSLMLNDSVQRTFREFAGLASVVNQFKDVSEKALGLGSGTRMWIQQMESSRAQTRKLFDALGAESGIQRYLKDFEHINKQWNVPKELLNVVDSLQKIQGQIGKVALPTIDWGSAAALAKVLGQEGLEDQLAYLGIEPDGSLREPTETPEKGLLSRRQSDAVALVGLLLAVIGIWMTIQIFIYQENSGEAQQAKNDEQAARQFRQLESLNRLVEKALERAAKEQEEHFVVRERAATVRSRPKHGASVQGKLLPNEVVRAIDRDGKWIEIEYYHWLHEEYRTGWTLKKYLQRVPANHAKAADDS